MITYYIHTYQHASGHKTKTRRSVYGRNEREKAMENLALLGGTVEPVSGNMIIHAPRNRTKR